MTPRHTKPLGSLERGTGRGPAFSSEDIMVISMYFFVNPGLIHHGIWMGVSENSVPLNPMVNDHYPY